MPLVGPVRFVPVWCTASNLDRPCETFRATFHQRLRDVSGNLSSKIWHRAFKSQSTEQSAHEKLRRGKIQKSPEVGQKSAQGRPKVGPKSTWSAPKIGPKSVQSQPKVGSKLAQSRSKVGRKSKPKGQDFDIHPCSKNSG